MKIYKAGFEYDILNQNGSVLRHYHYNLDMAFQNKVEAYEWAYDIMGVPNKQIRDNIKVHVTEMSFPYSLTADLINAIYNNTHNMDDASAIVDAVFEVLNH